MGLLAVLEEKMPGCVGDELVADGGAQHDVLGEHWAGELSDGLVDVDGGRQVASLCRRGEDVADGLEDAAHETALGGNEGSIVVGVVEESRKDGAERLPCNTSPEVDEGGGEVILEVVGDGGWGVGGHDSIDGVQEQSVLVGPMLVDGRARHPGMLGDTEGGDRAGSFGQQ